VVDNGGHPERPNVGRKRRFDTRGRTLALQRFDETGFLTTNIGPGTTVQKDIEAHIGPPNMLPQIPGGINPLTPRLHPLCPQKKLATQIDKGQTGSHGVTTDNEPFEYLMRVFFDEHAVFEGAWFRLVTVANEIAWAIIFRQKPPFDTSRKASPPSATQ